MANQAKLNLNITVGGGALKVGANPQPPNTFTLSITNEGDSARYTPLKPLFLSFRLGSGQEALFRTATAARKCVPAVPKDWTAEWDFPGDDDGRLKIYSAKKSLQKGESLEIVIPNVISDTNQEGSAWVSLESPPDFKQEGSIAKTAVKPDIIYFISEPEEGVQNLPGDSVTLRWRTYEVNDRELTQVGDGTPLPTDLSEDEGNYTVKVGEDDMIFRLKGSDRRTQKPLPNPREVSVKVLKSGWYSRRNTIFEGDRCYPPADIGEQARARSYDLEPTLLLNAKDVSLYVVFRHIFQGKDRAFLFQTKNPFGPWRFVKTSVHDQPAGICIPEGFSTSPGVYYDDKLWLVGGSQVDPDVVSNTIWRLDPNAKEKVWENLGAANPSSKMWSPRMGHAVLEFQGKIWVMGGRDAAGNALNDVWRLDNAAKNEWTPLGQARWTARCMFSPAVFQKDQIWLYGGAQEPFSSELKDDVYVYKNSSWTEVKLTGIISEVDKTLSRKPIASCLQEFKGCLCLFGKFRTIASDKSEKNEPLAFSLSTPSTKTWDDFPNDGLKNWGGNTTFSYQLVNFKNLFLIAKALSYEAPNPVMKVYVPS